MAGSPPHRFSYRAFDVEMRTPPDGLAEHVALRKAVFTERYAGQTRDPGELSRTMDENDFDWRSVLVTARHGGAPVGTLRIVGDSELGLPLEQESGQRCDALRRRGRIAEVGRLAIVAEWRLRPNLYVALMLGVFAYALDESVRTLVADMPGHLVRSYRAQGFVPFGTPFRHAAGGSIFLPGCCDVAALIDAGEREGADEAAEFRREILVALERAFPGSSPRVAAYLHRHAGGAGTP